MIANTPKKGRCVFADIEYKEGDTVEICEYITIPNAQIDILKGTVLNSYRFGKDVQKEDAQLLLGNGSLYNHSKTPNMVAVIDDADGRIGFVAIKDIKPGDELTFNYGYTPNCALEGDYQIVARVKKEDLEKTCKP